MRLGVKQVLVSGTMKVEGFSPWPRVLQLSPGDDLPFRILLTTAGSESRDLAVVIGDADATAALTDPLFATRIHLKAPASRDPEIAIDTLAASNVSADVSHALLRALAPGLLPERDYAAHLDRISVTGTVVLAAQPTFDGAIDVHELSLRSAEGRGAAGAALPPVVVDRLSFSTKISGPLTMSPLRDLAISKVKMSCDLGQYDAWRVTRAVAGVQVSAREIEIGELEASSLDGTLLGSGTFDLDSGAWTHGSISLQGASAAKFMSRLSESLQQPLPMWADGQVTARLALLEPGGEGTSARFDLVSPGQLKAGAAGAGVEAVSVNNAAMGGILTWHGDRAAPELSHGRITADTFSAAIPLRPEKPLAVKDVAVDFDVAGGMASVDDLRATVGESTLVSGNGHFDLQRWNLDQGSVAIRHLEGAAVSGMLAGEAGVEGDFDVSAEFASEGGGTLSLTIEGGQQVSIRMPVAIGGALEMGGKPVLSMKASMKASTQGAARDKVVTIEAASVRGLETVGVDAALMKFLQGEVERVRGETSLAARLLDRLHDGLSLSMRELTLKGRWDVNARNFAGEVALNNLEAATLPEAAKAARVTGLTLKAGLTWERSQTDPQPRLRISDGELTADKLLVDGSVFSGCAATFAAWNGSMTAPRVAFDFAEGTFRGEAVCNYRGSLEKLHLKVTNLDEKQVAANCLGQSVGAEGRTAGTIDLNRDASGRLMGTITLTTDTDGKLLFSKDAVTGRLEGVSKSTAADIAAFGATLPSDFEQIVIGQLASYSYTAGHASLTDTADGLVVTFDYSRSPLKPTDPGYGAQVTIGGRETTTNIAIDLRDVTLTVPEISVADVLARALGVSDFMSSPGAQVAAPAMFPATFPAAP